MLKRNFFTSDLESMAKCHDGEGVLQNIGLYSASDFQSALQFFNYTVLPPGTSIGSHTHGDDEEVYIMLEGCGLMTVNGETQLVAAGDVVVNPPFGTHSLCNNSNADLKILVFEAGR